MNIDWPIPLRIKNASPVRLPGVVVFHDFDWAKTFGNNRSQFRNGRRLALLAQNDCPKGKKPGLLLTTMPDAEETVIESEELYLVVVNVTRYVGASADPALTYLASRLKAPITALSRTQLLRASTEDLAWLLDQRLNAVELRRWAATNSVRRDLLASVISTLGDNKSPPHDPSAETLTTMAPDDVARALLRLEHLGKPLIDAICCLLESGVKAEGATRLLRSLTSTDDGRRQAVRVIGQQISQRIADARFAATLYQGLLRNPNTNETDFQRMIEDYPWLIGLDYVEVRHRQEIPRGQLDFIIKRYDGFYDLIELKDPQDPIVAINSKAATPPSPSDYSLSPVLAQALAQAHAYRDTLTSHEEAMSRLYGLEWTRNPRLIIVIGRLSIMSEAQRRILEQMNLSLHRVEIVPYDLLAERAELFISNVERYLVRDTPAESGGIDSPVAHTVPETEEAG